jgi:hypothetical protein
MQQGDCGMARCSRGCLESPCRITGCVAVCWVCWGGIGQGCGVLVWPSNSVHGTLRCALDTVHRHPAIAHLHVVLRAALHCPRPCAALEYVRPLHLVHRLLLCMPHKALSSVGCQL